MAEQSSQKSNEEFEKGDIIEFPRTLPYSHFAVATGDGNVVHWTSDPTSTKRDKGVIKEEKLSDVAGRSIPRKRNDNDKQMQPLPSDQIVQRAREAAKSDAKYNLLTNNCEHFATDCRYGKSFSNQVTNAANNLIKASEVMGLAPITAEDYINFEKDSKKFVSD